MDARGRLRVYAARLPGSLQFLGSRSRRVADGRDEIAVYYPIGISLTVVLVTLIGNDRWFAILDGRPRADVDGGTWLATITVILFLAIAVAVTTTWVSLSRDRQRHHVEMENLRRLGETASAWLAEIERAEDALKPAGRTCAHSLMRREVGGRLDARRVVRMTLGLVGGKK
jgi:hypothetical protein